MIKLVQEFPQEVDQPVNVKVKHDEARRTIRMTAENGYEQTVVRITNEGRVILPKIYCSELAKALGISVGTSIKLESE